ncbi:imm11 family protein [Pyxidicoccus sp. 3LG]
MARNDSASLVERAAIPDVDEDDLEFTDGVRLGPLPVLKFTQTRDTPGQLLDYVPSSPHSMLVSSRFKDALDSAGVDNIDYYPAEITNESTGKVHRGYYAANIIGMIAGLDRSKTLYTPMPSFPDTVLEFKELHLDLAKVHGAKVFRLQESCTTLLMHESVKQAIEKAGLRGMELLPAEGYEGI